MYRLQFQYATDGAAAQLLCPDHTAATSPDTEELGIGALLPDKTPPAPPPWAQPWGAPETLLT